MGHKAWANTVEKRAFLSTLTSGYNAVKTVKGDGGACAKNIPLQKFLDNVRSAWTERFGTKWDEVRLPGIGLGGTEIERLQATRERFRQYLNNHQGEMTSGKGKRPSGKSFLQQSRNYGLSITEALYRLKKEEFDVDMAAEFDKHCETKGVPEENRKKALLGFRSSFLKRKLDEASEEEKDEARKLIETTKVKETEDELQQYGWPDSDTIGHEELVRRHQAMERAEKIAELPGGIHLMEDKVAKDVEGITITLVGYIQPKKEGKPSFISTCHGKDLNGKTFSEHNPELWTQMKNGFAAFLANAFKKEDRERLAIPALFVGKDITQAGVDEDICGDRDQSLQQNDLTRASSSTGDTNELDANTDWGDLFGELFTSETIIPTVTAVSHVTANVEVTIDDNDDNDKDDSDSSLDDFTADLNTQLYDEDSNNLDSQSMIPPRPAPLIAASYDFALPSVENVAPPLDIIQNGYVEEPSRSTPESYLAMLTEPLQSAPSTSDTNRWDPGQYDWAAFYQSTPHVQSLQRLEATYPISDSLTANALLTMPTFDSEFSNATGDPLVTNFDFSLPETLSIADQLGVRMAESSVDQPVLLTTPPRVQAVAALENVTNKEHSRPRPRLVKSNAGSNLPTAPPSSVAVNPPATTSTPDDLPQPKWVKDYQREVRKILCDGSEKNLEMVDKAYALEKVFKLKPDVMGLSMLQQPAAITWLVERGHDFSNTPPLTKLVEGKRTTAKTTAEAFASVFLPYYNRLMPPCRRAKGETLGRPIQPVDFSQWRAICRCGMNGISLLVQGFAWWYRELNPTAETNEIDSIKYTAAVEDFIWVLDLLLEGACDGFITWIDEAGEAGGRRGRSTKRPLSTSTGSERPGRAKKAKI